MPIDSAEDSYHALSAYTWTRGDPEFCHQHVVDAFAAQSATERTKPIAITFALVGLYLFVERQWTGRQVQRVHTRLAEKKRAWPTLELPRERGATTAADVLRAAAGPDRDRAILEWCRAVWAAHIQNRDAVVALLSELDIS